MVLSIYAIYAALALRLVYLVNAQEIVVTRIKRNESMKELKNQSSLRPPALCSKKEYNNNNPGHNFIKCFFFFFLEGKKNAL